MEYVYLYFLIVGMVSGSFFNVVGLRVPLGKSIIAPRSACPRCGHQLRSFELIPVLSYLLQGGKCRGCRSRISPVYPIMELLTGVLFMTAPYFVGWSWELLVALSLISLFVIITVSDIHYMIIPDKILLVFAGIFLLLRIFFPLFPWYDSLVGAATGFLLLLIIALVSKGGMGFGDVKLFGLLGFVLGTKLVLLSFFLSTLIGAVVGLTAMLFGIVKRREPIPFGPFIVAGTLIAYYFGNELILLYIHFIS
ncbi:MAG: prepilin peptidase [Bacillota bacterium]|nr:prepilin peptidase [Bacillota bacterium]